MGSIPAERRLNADSVCIIGAGPSGLAVAKYLLAERSFSRITIFEQRAVVGGLWNYIPCDDELPRDLSIPQTNPHAGLDKPIWESSNASKIFNEDTQEAATFMTPVYERLETNIPRGLMGFSDIDWPKDCQLFPKHKEVLEYINRYAEDIRHLVSFKTQVLDVRLKDNGKWNVHTQEVSRNPPSKIKEEEFDAVIVASGHFDVPYIPTVPGLEAWNEAYPGTITHSKFYRKPEHYAGKKVIVVGNSASGIDIGAQIATVSKWPLLQSQKSESYLLSDISPSKQEKPEITEYILEKRSVRFTDGSIESDIDSVLYCTGYFYSFPFLNSLDPPLITTGDRVENTYQHMFYRPNPSLAFLVLNQKVIPFPMAEAQSAVVARVLSGRLPLPCEDEMQSWERKVVDEMSDGRSFHVLKFPKDADYINMLHDWAMGADGFSEASVNGDGGPRRQKVGKTPPYWGEKEYWTRERFPLIKKAFQDIGEDRHHKRALEELGFDFQQWKREKAGGEQ